MATTAAPDIYCLKCSARTESRDVQVVTLKNGRQATRAFCVVCRTQKFRMGPGLRRLVAAMTALESAHLISPLHRGHGKARMSLETSGTTGRCLRASRLSSGRSAAGTVPQSDGSTCAWGPVSPAPLPHPLVGTVRPVQVLVSGLSLLMAYRLLRLLEYYGIQGDA